MTPEIFARWRPGMSFSELCQFRDASRRDRIAREREFARSERIIHAVMEEARRLTEMRFGAASGAKPRLERARAKLRLIESKSKPATVAPAPKSRTPRLDKYRPLLHDMQERAIADGILFRQPEYDHRGRLIGHRIKRSVMDYGRFEPTPAHACRLRLRSLESSIARPQRQAGEPIDIDARWSRSIP